MLIVMSALIYIHGFLSSPLSFKACQTQAWLAAHHPEITYHCPQLTPYPAQTRQQLECLLESLLPEPVYIMGSSLGGFWATWLAEKYNVRAVLINPAVRPYEFMPKYIGQSLKSYHSEDRYCLEWQHIKEIKAADVAPLSVDNYWLLVQTGDEVLNYTHALEKYADCRQTVEQGGDHAFQGLERFFDEIVNFFQEK
jgi:uncharacterized protein